MKLGGMAPTTVYLSLGQLLNMFTMLSAPLFATLSRVDPLAEFKTRIRNQSIAVKVE